MSDRSAPPLSRFCLIRCDRPDSHTEGEGGGCLPFRGRVRVRRRAPISPKHPNMSHMIASGRHIQSQMRNNWFLSLLSAGGWVFLVLCRSLERIPSRGSSASGGFYDIYTLTALLKGPQTIPVMINDFCRKSTSIHPPPHSLI